MPDGLIKQAPTTSIQLPALIGSMLMNAALVIFIGTILLVGGAFAYTKYLQGQVTQAKADLAGAQKGFEESALTQSVERDRKLQALSDLLRGHLIPTNIFDLLEKNTLAQVRFIVFAYSNDTHRLELSGEAGGYSVLANQVRVFESLPDIQRVDFGGLTLGDKGLLNFKMTLVIKPGLLQFK